MKKAILIIVLISLSLVSCISIKRNAPTEKMIDPSIIKYEEITMQEYLENYPVLSKIGRGYKISNLSLYSISDYSRKDYYEINGIRYIAKEDTYYMRIDYWSDDYYTVNSINCNATDFIEEKKQSDPTIWDRLKTVQSNRDFYEKYSIFIYFKETTILGSNPIVTDYIHVIEPCLYKIEGIPSQEQINEYVNKIEKMKTNLKEHTEKINSVAKEKYDDSKNQLDTKIQNSFKDYNYHGYDSRITSEEQLINDALFPNHAYYIKSFVLDGGVGKFHSSSQKKYYYKQIGFKTREMKSILSSGINLDVIIAGDKNGTPIVIGLVDEIAGEEKKKMDRYYSIIYNSEIQTSVVLMKFRYTEYSYKQLLAELKIYEDELEIIFDE